MSTVATLDYSRSPTGCSDGAMASFASPTDLTPYDSPPRRLLTGQRFWVRSGRFGLLYVLDRGSTAAPDGTNTVAAAAGNFLLLSIAPLS